ncbi:MerR family transcriptional regulator [Brevibacterium spongiae]|uniref:MerR family transcriptional regulator n=1 Tax=Brevibacterium spongiae TaxID=2909672 RepID=A0ABY5SLK6_9MICO|nr:MerR family transcriptional regulator [Brevibacterium spongiae]UVI35415.1 MerR family transcriptional regulator [Brevibacterium spongiae]
MKLSALAAAAGISTASIKFYIHEGLLPAGRKKNATTAVYDDVHLHRLELIRWLRDELSTPISDIADLTRAIGDESLSTIELMGICQEFALRGNSGLPASALRAPGSPPFTLRSGTGTEAAPRSPSDRFDGIVSEALDRLGWPDEESAARSALARVLEMVDAAGYRVSVESVVDQCRAIASTAGDNIRPIGTELSRDEVCLRVIRGITMHNRQLIATSALAHASLSMMARAAAGGDDAAVGEPTDSPGQ